MANPKLKVKKRNIFGRKVKNLRQKGILPANVYGKKIKSQAVQMEISQFVPVYREAGETGLVDLFLGKETKSRPILIHNVQLDPVTDKMIHADFHQVSLAEKITASIPIELTGASGAVEQKLGILVRLLHELEVEALPADLPEKIEVDISSLEKVGDMIQISGVKVDEKKVKLITDPLRLIVKIEPPTKVEEEKPPVEEAVSAEGEEEKPLAEKDSEGDGKESAEKDSGKKEAKKEDTKKRERKIVDRKRKV